MYENRDSYVDKPVLESRTVYISGNFNQIIKFELSVKSKPVFEKKPYL